MEKNLKSKSTVLMLLVMLALILVAFNGAPVKTVEPSVPAPSGPFLKYGPRVDRIIFHVSGGYTRECDDFEAGLMDVMDWPAPAERWDSWFADPGIIMGDLSEDAAIYLALNLMRWPLGHGDQLPWGWTSYPEGYISNHDLSLWNGDEGSSDLPVGTSDKTWIDYDCQRCLDSRWYRRALAHMVDRASQVAYMAGGGAPLEPSLYYPSLESWEHPNVTELYDVPTDYITRYVYALVKARDCFLAGGFKDWDNDGTLEYSPSHGAVEDWEELPKLHFYTRIDDAERVHLGRLISDDMTLLGVPHFLDIATYGTVATQVWALYDYDIYTEYWDWGPTPDLYSEWFASKMDIYPDPWGNNEHRYHSEEFDVWAAAFTESATPEEAMQYGYKMQEYIHRDAVAIPVYSHVGYLSHRTKYGNWPGEAKYAGKNWAGMCNPKVPGAGFATDWTKLNAHPEGYEKGGTLRQGLNVDASNLDIMDTWYSYDWHVMYQTYETLTVWSPYALTFEPWLCESYEVGTWEHPTEGTCSAVNFTLIPGILWQDGEPMTWKDVRFSFWYTRECKSVTYMNAKDYYESVNYTTPLGKEIIEIRFDVLSWLAPTWCNYVPILPEHVWSDEYWYRGEQGPGVEGNPGYVPEDHDTVFGTGPFRFYKDHVVGRVDRVPGEYLFMEPNPIYFRKYIWPDVCYGKFPEYNDPTKRDGQVTPLDFAKVAEPANIFARENDDGTWPTPPGAWGEPCDVNKDGKIGVGDLMEIGVNHGKPWPPAYYQPTTW